MQDFDNYKKIANYYDFFTNYLLKDVRSTLVELCLANSFKQVLDLGCGTGQLALNLALNKLQVVGVDNSNAMLKETKKNRLKTNIKKLEAQACYLYEPSFMKSDIANLPFKNNSFDLVIISLVLHETEADIFSVISEALRVANNILILDYRLPERNLDIPASYLVHIIEKIAGKQHYLNFKNFMNAGGLQGLVYQITKKFDLIISKDIGFYYGALGAILLKKKDVFL